jgi:hypothetical protein
MDTEKSQQGFAPITAAAHNEIVARFNNIMAQMGAKPSTKRRAEFSVAYYSGVQAALNVLGHEPGARIVAPLMLGGREPEPVKVEG